MAGKTDELVFSLSHAEVVCLSSCSVGNQLAHCILLKCIREIEVRGNVITHPCQPCSHVGCLHGLIMTRMTYLYL